MTKKIYPIILCGGQGKRLWPVSTYEKPKQFASFFGSQNLLEETLNRLNDDMFHAPLIVCNKQHEGLLKHVVDRSFGKNTNIILEPIARNTAAAAAIATKFILEKDENAKLLILASDHFINPLQAFHDIINQAIDIIQENHIVAFGIKPAHPYTGYGYIEIGESSSLKSNIYPIKSFHEKPDLNTAQDYINTGQFFWNSGIFAFNASYMEKLFQQHSDDIWQKITVAYANMKINNNLHTILKKDYIHIQNIAFDIAIMEKTYAGFMIECDMEWSDLGSWNSIWHIMEKNEDNNVIQGNNITVDDTYNSYIKNNTRGNLAVLGLDNVIAIYHNEDVILCSKDQSENIKNVAKEIELKNKLENVQGNLTYRPWGCFEILTEGYSYQVKRLTINTGGIISLQYHNHRSENWVVVSGTASVTLEDKMFDLYETESVYIPKGKIHRVENKQPNPLIIIEVQSGDVLKEEDIIRLEDVYGRS